MSAVIIVWNFFASSVYCDHIFPPANHSLLYPMAVVCNLGRYIKYQEMCCSGLQRKQKSHPLYPHWFILFLTFIRSTCIQLQTTVFHSLLHVCTLVVHDLKTATHFYIFRSQSMIQMIYVACCALLSVICLLCYGQLQNHILLMKIFIFVFLVKLHLYLMCPVKVWSVRWNSDQIHQM